MSKGKRSRPFSNHNVVAKFLYIVNSVSVLFSPVQCKSTNRGRFSLPAVGHAVAVPQPAEAGHLVAWRSTVEVYDDVIVCDQQFKATDDVTDNTPSSNVNNNNNNNNNTTAIFTVL